MTTQRLVDPEYMSFPFAIGESGARASGRIRHVREQIEQVLFTHPGERVFRPEFGAGVRAFVFEPNDSALWEMAQNRLQSSLSEALQGEVDPKTLRIDIDGDEEDLLITISYSLAAINHTETHQIKV